MMYDSKQIAQHLGISPIRVRQLCQGGRIPAAKKLGSAWYVERLSDLAPVRIRKPGKPVTPARKKAAGSRG